MPVMKADIQTIEAKKAGSVDLDEHIFGLEPRAVGHRRQSRYLLPQSAIESFDHVSMA